MSAKPSATTPAKEPAKEPAKSKLLLIGAIVVVLAVLAVAAFLFFKARSDDETQPSSAEVLVPTFLPLESMVVNLADPGADRFVQLGITLELQDDKTASLIRQYLPSIRNGVLLLVSQRSSQELLAREGKEKLAAEIREEVSRPLGLGASSSAAQSQEEVADESERPRRRQNAVRRVLFSSFIIQ